MESGRVSTVLMAVAVGCALTMTVLAVRRELIGVKPPQGVAPREISGQDWDSIKRGLHRRGPLDAAMVIVEYADFECPFCKMYNRDVLQPLLQRFPDDVALVFRHWPLPTHPSAMKAAVLAECSAAARRFWDAHDLLYELADSLQTLTPSRFAERLSLGDIDGFVDCAESATTARRIASDSATIIRLGGRGTPAVIVDGVLYDRPPSLDELVERIESRR